MRNVCNDVTPIWYNAKIVLEDHFKFSSNAGLDEVELKSIHSCQ